MLGAGTRPGGAAVKPAVQPAVQASLQPAVRTAVQPAVQPAVQTAGGRTRVDGQGRPGGAGGGGRSLRGS